MQRFKKMLRSEGFSLTHLNGGNFRQCRVADSFGKFIYGATGSMTQATRWRREAFIHAGFDGDMSGTATPVPVNWKHFRALIDSARRGGCRLP